MHRILAATVALLVLVAGCGDDATQTAASTTTTAAESTTTSADEPAEEPTGANVELLDAGSEPRRELRFAVEEGVTQDLVMTQVQEQSVDVAGESQSFAAATEQTMRIVVDSVTDDEMATSVTFGGGRVLDDPPVDPATRAAVEQAIAIFDGLTGTTVTDLRGRVLEADLPAPTDVPAELGSVVEPLLEAFDSQASQLSMPFPEEPVGVGARWRATTDFEVSGMAFDVVTEVTLTEVGDGSAAADMTQRLTVVPGAVEAQGSSFEVVEGAMEGTGTLRWDLYLPLPVSEQEMSGTIVLAFGGTELRQGMRMQLSTRPA